MNGLYECNLCGELWVINMPPGYASTIRCIKCLTMQVTRTPFVEGAQHEA